MFVSEGVINHSSEDFPYDRIATVTSSRGMVFGKIVISTAGVSHVVEQVDKNEAEAVAAVLRERVEATTRERYAPPAPAPYQQHYAPPAHAAPQQHYGPPAHAAPSQGYAPSPPPSSGPTGPGGFSIAAELRELAELRDQGVLTNEEFEGQKARLLPGRPTPPRPEQARRSPFGQHHNDRDKPALRS